MRNKKRLVPKRASKFQFNPFSKGNILETKTADLIINSVAIDFTDPMDTVGDDDGLSTFYE